MKCCGEMVCDKIMDVGKNTFAVGDAIRNNHKTNVLDMKLGG